MGKRRGNREGSLYRIPSGNWRAQVTIHGKRLGKTFASWKEGNDWIRTITEQAQVGLTYDKAKIILSEYLTDWLASAKVSLRPATYRNYTIHIEKRLIPALGHVLVKDLTTDHIQHVYDAWLRKGIGAATIIKTHAVLHGVLNRAADTGLLPRNVSDSVKLPRRRNEEMKIWTEEEANRFLTAARDNRMYALFYLALVTGARQMELLGLKWPDVDWIKGTLLITRQLARHNGMFAPLKTKAAKRTLNLGNKGIAVLREHLDRQGIERQVAGKRWQDHDLIFTNTHGGPMHHKNLTDRYYRPIIARAGVPAIRFHDLRHTAASIMLTHGKPLFLVSKMLGHARPSITSDIYGHLVPGGEQDSIISMMDELIAPVEIDIDDIAG